MSDIEFYILRAELILKFQNLMHLLHSSSFESLAIEHNIKPNFDWYDTFGHGIKIFSTQGEFVAPINPISNSLFVLGGGIRGSMSSVSIKCQMYLKWKEENKELITRVELMSHTLKMTQSINITQV